MEGEKNRGNASESGSLQPHRESERERERARKATMAEAFQQDLTCSVCLELFTEPVVLRCGHWFCKDCITSCWDAQGSGDSCCPDCRAPCPDRRCTPNRLLENLAKKAREVQENATRDAVRPNAEAREEEEEEEKDEPEGAKNGQQGRLCCEVHGEEFLLFCTTDETCICSQCVNSWVHAGHSFSSLKDGAEAYKEKLATALEPLERRIKKLEQHEESQKTKIRSLQDSAAFLQTNIKDKFSEIHQALQERQAAMLAELDEDEKVAHKDMEDRLQQIQESLRVAKQMMSQGKTQMALNSPGSFLLFSENKMKPSELQEEKNKGICQFLGKLTSEKEATSEGEKDPLAVLCRELSLGKFKGPTQHLACRPLCPVFAQELESVQLDDHTAHPVLRSASNGTSVAAKRTPPCNSNGVWMVFGTTGFISGRHYWEVEIQSENQWYVGVALESVKGKNQIEDIKGKIWIRHLDGMEGTSPDGCRVGVYLGYEEGQVSFYNARNGSHLGSWRTQFKEKVYPFFCHPPNARSVASLRICQK